MPRLWFPTDREAVIARKQPARRAIRSARRNADAFPARTTRRVSIRVKMVLLTDRAVAILPNRCNRVRKWDIRHIAKPDTAVLRQGSADRKEHV